jgi:hypothetical protein
MRESTQEGLTRPAHIGPIVARSGSMAPRSTHAGSEGMSGKEDRFLRLNGGLVHRRRAQSTAGRYVPAPDLAGAPRPRSSWDDTACRAPAGRGGAGRSPPDRAWALRGARSGSGGACAARRRSPPAPPPPSIRGGRVRVGTRRSRVHQPRGIRSKRGRPRPAYEDRFERALRSAGGGRVT